MARSYQPLARRDLIGRAVPPVLSRRPAAARTLRLLRNARRRARGGLGAALASAGVVALTVESGPGPSSPAGAGGDASDLERALVRSPRLLSRASGGTLELAPTRATDLEVEGAREKHGCAGCPTPCGWSFQVEGRGGPSGAPRVGGRFSALQGFADRGDPLALLQRCNDLGVDARVAARLLAGAGDVDPEAGISSRPSR